MNAIVTGTSGFVGGELYRFLEEKGHIVYGLSRSSNPKIKRQLNVDLTCENWTKKTLASFSPQYIFHCAANPLTDLSKCDVNEVINCNITATANIAKSLPKDCKLIYFSSCAIYSDRALTDGATEKSVCQPASFYGITKLASELIVKTYAKDYLIVRPCAITGPTATHGVVHDLVRKYINDEVVEIIGECPGTKKPYLHIDDLCKMVYHAALNFKHNDIYNICPDIDDNITIKELYDVIKYVFDKQRQVKWTGKTWDGDNKVVNLSNCKFKDEFGLSNEYLSLGAVGKTVKSLFKQHKQQDNY